MRRNNENIDYDWLIKPTGDSFADTGGYVIKYLSEKYPEKNILELIEYMAKIYVNRWDGKINPFFLNSSITQPAFKGNVKITETIKYFSSLINETAKNELGFCRITGRQTRLFKAGRDNSLMSGSGTFVNFHHNFQLGLMLSKEMIIRMFFIPYGSVFVGGRIAIIHSNSFVINEFFVRENCKKNDTNIAVGTSDGLLKSEYGMPANALFRFVDDILDKSEEKESNVSLGLYHFTNFGASPEIVIYKLPSNVFSFYIACNNLLKLKSDWRNFVLAHYSSSKFKNAKYNESNSSYDIAKKNDIEQIGFEDFKTWRNVVLENLLHGKSLLRLFLNWSKKREFNFTIVEIYQKYIQNMKQETISKIKELALYLTDMEEDVIKRNIRTLDGAKNAYELRRFFLNRMVKTNYNANGEKPIITVDELVCYLFPDDISWRDVRDVLLIAIYQNLHEKKIRMEIATMEETDENEE